MLIVWPRASFPSANTIAYTPTSARGGAGFAVRFCHMLLMAEDIMIMTNIVCIKATFHFTHSWRNSSQPKHNGISRIPEKESIIHTVTEEREA